MVDAASGEKWSKALGALSQLSDLVITFDVSPYSRSLEEASNARQRILKVIYGLQSLQSLQVLASPKLKRNLRRSTESAVVAADACVTAFSTSLTSLCISAGMLSCRLDGEVEDRPTLDTVLLSFGQVTCKLQSLCIWDATAGASTEQVLSDQASRLDQLKHLRLTLGNSDSDGDISGWLSKVTALSGMTTIDINLSGITDGGDTVLLDPLLAATGYIRGLKALRVSAGQSLRYNPRFLLAIEGPQALRRQSVKCEALTTLELTCRLRSGVVDALSECFPQMMNLKELKLIESYLGIDQQELETLALKIPLLSKLTSIVFALVKGQIEGSSGFINALVHLRSLQAFELGLQKRSEDLDGTFAHLDDLCKLIQVNTDLRHVWIYFSGRRFLTSHECVRLLKAASDSDHFRLWRIREALRSFANRQPR